MNGGLSASCTPDKFNILEHNQTSEYGYMTVVGVIRNGCSEPAAPELKLSQYGSDGKLLATNDEWVTSVTNILPFSKYQFKLMDSEATDAQRYSISVIDVHHW